jgi:hypothetical protein
MKKVVLLIFAAAFVVSSCSVDRLFNIGVRLPSPYSRNAKKKFKEIEGPFDVIVVPGFPYDPKDVSSILDLRIRWARYLFNEGLTENVIFSGSAVYTPYYEGIAMKLIADSMGLPAHHTFSEIQAEHSIENVYYSVKMAQRMGFKRIAVATDPFQSRMLKPLIEKYCPGIELIPMVYSRIKREKNKIPSIDSSTALAKEFVSLVDRQTKIQRQNGTMGRRVAYEIELEKSHELLLEPGQPELYMHSDSSAVNFPQ